MIGDATGRMREVLYEEHPERVVESILQGLAESVIDASDEDILEECRERGEDPEKEAENIRRILLEAIEGEFSRQASRTADPPFAFPEDKPQPEFTTR